MQFEDRVIFYWNFGFLFLYSWLSCTFKKEYLFEEDEVYANFKLDFFFIIVLEVFDHKIFLKKVYLHMNEKVFIRL